MGFYPQTRAYIEKRINEVPFGLDGVFGPSAYTLEHVLDVNERLTEYAKWWDLFDICVQVCDRVCAREYSLHWKGFARFPLSPKPRTFPYISGA